MLRSASSQTQWPWHAVFSTVILIVFTLIWSVQSAHAESDGLIGRIESKPTGGLIGEWQVAGSTFVTSAATQFRQENGQFVVGRCVEVELVAVGEQQVATKLATKRDEDCRTATPTATPAETDATVTPEASPTPDDEDDSASEVLARIEAMPLHTLRGLWQIGGVHYLVNMQSRLRQGEGPFNVGACVQVEYIGDAEPYVVVRLATERGAKCRRNATPTPEGTIPSPTVPALTVTPEPSSTPTHSDDVQVIGWLGSFPEDLIGLWVIDGKAYTATVDTEFEQHRGRFAEGACVKAQLPTADATLLREIETTNRFRCGSVDDGGEKLAKGVLYGVIQEIPEDPDLIGDWQIGGATVTTDAATIFDQRRAAFDVNVIVKVKFIAQSNGTLYAVAIESKFARDDHDDEHHHNDIYEGAEGHAYGVIDTLPGEALPSIWVVAGISYTVTSDTRFVQPHSEFAVGTMVRVKYRTDSEGNRIARQIKTTRGNGGASSHEHAVLYSFVVEMPIDGFVGQWIIDSVVFTATERTQFKEENGLFTLGSYVKVEYYTVDGQNVIHEIETLVPPDAGDSSAIGEIDTIEEESAEDASVRSAKANATTWTIGGQQYVVTPATDLNEFQGDLVVGQQAYVNSYTAADGSQVATQIRGVTLAHELYLPAVIR